jgi:hypothetical protein
MGSIAEQDWRRHVDCGRLFPTLLRKQCVAFYGQTKQTPPWERPHHRRGFRKPKVELPLRRS